MYALTVIVSNAESHIIHPGTLHRTPIELLTPEQKRRYLAAPKGWSICPLGFHIFTASAADGSRVIVPGIILPDERRPKRKLPDYKVEYDKTQVENFVSSILDESSRVEEAAKAELQGLTHDMRALSAEIYNAAELAKSDIEARRLPAASYRTDTVIAAQQILSIRLDIVDFSTGQFMDQAPERIPVYKKVHKVINCLKPKSISSSINLQFQGPSDAMTFGPPIFELVPFVLIQNALKYSPSYSEVVIKVSDFETHIDLHVQSLGPKIRNSEIDQIFDRGFRGVEAKKSGESGSGLGLFAAKTLVHETFGGSIKVIQDTHAAVISDQEFFRTTFSVQVPRVP